MIRFPGKRPTDYQFLEQRIGQVQSPPDLRAMYGEQIERYVRLNTAYQFSESFDAEYVYDQVESAWAMRRRELFGIPFGVKDVFNTKVLPTSMGSEIWKGFHAGNNARVIDEIVDRGGIVFSKTTTAEFAVHYIQNGRTINPHNAKRITGTSSSGSAVAVACGALPVALATQTAGSIVRPASFCGVYGFKPSFGAFDRTGTLKTTDTLDTIGLLGSDIHGLRKSFLAAFQKDPQYPLARNYFERLDRFRETALIRLGTIDQQFSGYSEYESYVKQDFGSARESLAHSGIEVSAVKDVAFMNDIHALHQRIYCKSLSYYFRDEYKDEAGMSEVMKQMISLGSQISVPEYVDALKRQPEYRNRFNAAIEQYDFLITPSTASVAPRIGEGERDDTCLIWTFLGYPVISIPAFWSSEHDLPFGLQIVGPKFSDLALLDFADRVVAQLSGVGR